MRYSSKSKKSYNLPHWTKHIKNRKTKKQLERRFVEIGQSPEGKVIKILKRNNEAVIATYYKKNFQYAQPDDVLLPKSIELDPIKHMRKINNAIK